MKTLKKDINISEIKVLNQENKEKNNVLVMRNENFSLKTAMIKNKLDEIAYYIGNIKQTAFSLEEKTEYLLKIENKILKIEEKIETLQKQYDREKEEKSRIFEKTLELKTILKIRNDDFDTMFLKIKDLKVYQKFMEQVNYQSILEDKKHTINDIINKIENIEIELLTMELNKIKHNEIFNKIDHKFKALINDKKLLEKEKFELNTTIREETKTIGTLGFSPIYEEKAFIDVEAVDNCASQING